MQLRIGMENNYQGRSLAWTLDYPGCFAYGQMAEEALAALPMEVEAYARWIEKHSGKRPFDAGKIECQLEESFEVYEINERFEREAGAYEVNAWFLDDWKALQAGDADYGLRLLTWSRLDLQETVQGLAAETLERKYAGERWNINGILKHIGGAEWWYLDRLGLAFPKDELPVSPLERLEKVRLHFEKVLPTLIDQPMVLGKDGEFWSPRKMLRRTVWHERDHTLHIQKLIRGGGDEG